VNSNVRALARFWWLVVIGLIAGAAAATAVYRAETNKRYAATTQLLVNSPNAPYLRTGQTQVTPHATTVRRGRKSIISSGSDTSVVAPDTQTVVNAANLYPFLIQSVQIAAYRDSMFGSTPGTVTAVAHNASTNTYGVYHPSPLPIIDVTAHSKLASDASTLAQQTVEAFSKWIVAEQRSKGIPASQRIDIQALTAPTVTTLGGPKLGLPLFVGFLVLLGFCGLAIVLGRVRQPSAEATKAGAVRATVTSVSPKLDS